MTTELKLCPFCGGEAKITKHFREEEWRLIHRCKVIGPIIFDWASVASLINTWNTRAWPMTNEELISGLIRLFLKRANSPLDEDHDEYFRMRDSVLSRMQTPEQQAAYRGLVEGSKASVKRFLHGCGNHSCRISKPKGQGTNGICSCAGKAADMAEAIKSLVAKVEEAEKQ